MTKRTRRVSKQWPLDQDSGHNRDGSHLQVVAVVLPNWAAVKIGDVCWSILHVWWLWNSWSSTWLMLLSFSNLNLRHIRLRMHETYFSSTHTKYSSHSRFTQEAYISWEHRTSETLDITTLSCLADAILVNQFDYLSFSPCTFVKPVPLLEVESPANVHCTDLCGTPTPSLWFH